mgnify:CR=1 FL=1|tara:strand:+ start:375 stop:893 length:519 start_codon:yes stop_codon:yes gene_type:complete
MAFWTSEKAEPLRKFRFMVNSNWYWVKSVTKPSFDITSNEYQLINHKFKYPGIVTWADIDITIVDSKEFGNSKGLYGQLSEIGYNLGGSSDGISKTKAIAAELGNVGGWQIQQLGADGVAIETWKLINPWIKSVKFGDLDYSSDDLVDITITISYDSATLTEPEVAPPTGAS